MCPVEKRGYHDRRVVTSHIFLQDRRRAPVISSTTGHLNLGRAERAERTLGCSQPQSAVDGEVAITELHSHILQSLECSVYGSPESRPPGKGGRTAGTLRGLARWAEEASQPPSHQRPCSPVQNEAKVRDRREAGTKVPSRAGHPHWAWPLADMCLLMWPQGVGMVRGSRRSHPSFSKISTASGRSFHQPRDR